MSNYKVLIADDEPQIREILRVYFQKEGFQVIEAENGQDALDKVDAEHPDIILLDIMMPVMDGLQVCEKVRKQYDIPIIMLTAKDDDDDRILGLETGADDYITKPFNTREVVARVKAVLRRAGGFQLASGKKTIEFPGLFIDQEKMEVTSFGRKVTFTTKEFELLWYLASTPGKVYSRNQLLESIWGYTYFGDTRTVDTHIKRIRQKLAVPKDSTWDIATVWGVGYKFELKQPAEQAKA
ncbi:MAG: response regulator transcription factor [Succiniclasticum sp.]|jgi:two-component system response regulator ResD|nr:response regulator transcription factor [Succiniclasticum sp.]MEE3478446.1 response regulator transcription factor [Succiniclasticum sp.]